MSRYRHRRTKYSPEYGFILLLAAIGLSIYTKNQQMLSLLIPVAVLCVIIFIIYQLYKGYQHEKLARTGIFDIDKMTGSEFEERLMVLYRNLGYDVKHIGHTGDAGVDLIVEKNGRKTAIQAKRYDGNVPESAVQQVHTGKDYYHCDEAIIVSNSNFTEMAKEVAKVTNIQLLSRNDLIKLLQAEQGK